MNTSTTVNKSAATNSSTTVLFERLWRSGGIQFVFFFVIAYAISGGDGMRIAIATFLFGYAILNLLWFAAALRSMLHEAGQGGWGAAVTASSAAFASIYWVVLVVFAALAHSSTAPGSDTLTSGLNELVWAGIVISSFPRAMLIMAGTFGLWRAGIISNGLFTAGVAVVIFVLLGGTTWMSNGIWAPDGTYSRLISPIIGMVWIFVTSRILLTQGPSTGEGW